MPLSRLLPIGRALERIVIPDNLALEELGINIRNFPGSAVMTNYSSHRVTISHWNGSVPQPQEAPISVARSIQPRDIFHLDEVDYEYEESVVT